MFDVKEEFSALISTGIVFESYWEDLQMRRTIVGTSKALEYLLERVLGIAISDKIYNDCDLSWALSAIVSNIVSCCYEGDDDIYIQIH